MCRSVRAVLIVESDCCRKEQPVVPTCIYIVFHKHFSCSFKQRHTFWGDIVVNRDRDNSVLSHGDGQEPRLLLAAHN